MDQRCLPLSTPLSSVVHRYMGQAFKFTKCPVVLPSKASSHHTQLTLILCIMLSLFLISVLVGEAVSQVSCTIPVQAQVIDPRNSLVLDNVLPPAQFNATSVSQNDKRIVLLRNMLTGPAVPSSRSLFGRSNCQAIPHL